MEVAFELEGLDCVVGDVDIRSATVCDDGVGCRVSCEERCKVSKDVGLVGGAWTGWGSVCEIGCKMSKEAEIVRGGFMTDDSIAETGFGGLGLGDVNLFLLAVLEVKEPFFNGMG